MPWSPVCSLLKKPQALVLRLFGPGNSSGRSISTGAAADLLATVPAYAKLIEAFKESEGLTADQMSGRAHIITSLTEDPVYRCPDFEGLTCHSAQGDGLG
ncbi:MAG: hypothetical protein AAGK23_12160 [Pseudomonadota bacterium]